MTNTDQEPPRRQPRATVFMTRATGAVTVGIAMAYTLAGYRGAGTVLFWAPALVFAAAAFRTFRRSSRSS